jgi:hypothetical protein
MRTDIRDGCSSDQYAELLLEQFRDKAIDQEALGQALLFAGVKLLSERHGPEILAGYCLIIAESLRETGDIPRFRPDSSGVVRH